MKYYFGHQRHTNMKAIYTTQHGSADKAFKQREIDKPTPKPGEVLVKVEGFGLNFADVMARKGMYRDAPPLPSLLGYDVCGTVEQLGEGVTNHRIGDRVTALTRFGGYAEYAITDARAAAKIPDTMNLAEATALTTQYCTAYYAAAYVVNLFPGDKVLIHSAAGGVGTALMQYARHKGCEIFATTGSASKVELLKKAGAAHVINTSTTAFDEYIEQATQGDGVDVIFDAVGASYIRKGIASLAAGGRIVCYGAADMSGSANVFSQLVKGIQFGIYHPALFMMNSKSLIGVNMLKIADYRPLVLQHCLQEVVKLYASGVFKPQVGKVFKASEIADAHHYLESRQSTGKVACRWD
ncbi:MAG: zinc-binding dehydrogenase [Bacteroidetes bacterium]|nr:zinc-binding dehydrogenase [Bacteroidota bacterium]